MQTLGEPTSTQTLCRGAEPTPRVEPVPWMLTILSQMKHPLGPTLVVALALLVGSLFVGSNLFYNRAQELSLDDKLSLSAPLDDTFIHLQYARQIGQGKWLSYNDGDRPSSGASSLLYVVVLGGAHFVGFSGHKLLAFAIILGAGLLGVCSLLGYRLALRLSGQRRAGLWSGALIATNGALCGEPQAGWRWLWFLF